MTTAHPHTPVKCKMGICQGEEISSLYTLSLQVQFLHAITLLHGTTLCTSPTLPAPRQLQLPSVGRQQAQSTSQVIGPSNRTVPLSAHPQTHRSSCNFQASASSKHSPPHRSQGLVISQYHSLHIPKLTAAATTSKHRPAASTVHLTSHRA